MNAEGNIRRAYKKKAIKNQFIYYTGLLISQQKNFDLNKR